jgi:hypothetical protein
MYVSMCRSAGRSTEIRFLIGQVRGRLVVLGISRQPEVCFNPFIREEGVLLWQVYRQYSAVKS